MNEKLTDMSGKMCLVTGATSGIGEAAARALAGLGARIIILGRNRERCESSAAYIRSVSGNQAVDFLVADLSSQAEIRRVVGEFLERYDRLDVLINNAGGFFMKRQVSPDGIELTFALNHLNYFLLTNLLLPLVKSSAPARIVNVSSGAHRGAKIDFDDLESRRSYNSWKAYAQSKLANLLFTYELARRLDSTQVTVNAMHPGFVGTGLAKNNGWFYQVGLSIVHLVFARKPEEGARTIVYLAASPEVAGITGKYFFDEQVESSSPASYDEESARRLWQISAQMVNLEGE